MTISQLTAILTQKNTLADATQHLDFTWQDALSPERGVGLIFEAWDEDGNEIALDIGSRGFVPLSFSYEGAESVKFDTQIVSLEAVVKLFEEFFLQRR